MPQRVVWRLLCLVLCLGIAVFVWRRASRSLPMPAVGESANRPITLKSPYRNVLPAVEYVGDAACATCHAEVAHSYSRHPMGRSLAPAVHEPPERLIASVGNPFSDPSGEFRYRVEQRDEELWHHEERVSKQGEALFATSHRATYAVGSGEHGRSYLIDRDGWLFQSPITWYPQKQRWDLSPGYEKRNQHFTRPITTECLFCHTNFADHVPETVNRYRRPIFRGHTIGCERCHGPGQLHVVRHERGEKVSGTVDETIVNPADLEPGLRDSICQQCHLSGDVRIARQGRSLYDFRPGLPWHEFAAVYIKRARTDRVENITGHTEQMHASRCWQASQGKLGCISCHDPHESLPVAERPAFYRNRCQKCHETRPCTADVASRAAVSPPDNCVACHMPAVPTKVQHAAMTDHRVPRSKVVRDSSQAEANGLPLAHFHRDLVNSRDPQVLRDLGVALIRLNDEDASAVTPADRQSAISLLQAAIRQHPDDWDAQEALAHALWLQGQPDRSLAVFQQVLAARPEREFSLYSAASRAQQLKQYRLAAELWGRTIEANPWMQRPYQNLAQTQGEQRNWTAAEKAARGALELFPGDARSRQLLIESLLWQRQAEQATAELDKLVALEPGQADALRRWFAGHPARPSNESNESKR